jgi:dihydropteroate synthase
VSNKVEAFVALGSNLGDRRAALCFAVEGLIDVVAVSHVYETDPVGGPDGQGAYLNMVVKLHTTLRPHELLARCLALELDMGRVRTIANGPRTLDADVLLYGDVKLDEPSLIIPHPRMWDRRFVMQPLADVAAHRLPPKWDSQLAEGGVRRVAPLATSMSQAFLLPRHRPGHGCRVMGILNVTPDSFSDGGRWHSTEKAIMRGKELWRDGADIVDVGGESTRPGSSRVSEATELERVLPVVAALSADGITVSIDTTRASVARACVDAGALVVNDVSGGLGDPAMFRQVAELGVAFVMMHWRSHSAVMAQHADYDDVVVDVKRELTQRIERAVTDGVRLSQIVLDPGLGFSKSSDHNWELLAQLEALTNLGLPILVGASRKRFLGELLADSGSVRSTDERDASSAAVTAILVARHSLWGVRVHDVRPNADAILVAERLLGTT